MAFKPHSAYPMGRVLHLRNVAQIPLSEAARMQNVNTLVSVNKSTTIK